MDREIDPLYHFTTRNKRENSSAKYVVAPGRQHDFKPPEHYQEIIDLLKERISQRFSNPDSVKYHLNRGITSLHRLIFCADSEQPLMKASECLEWLKSNPKSILFDGGNNGGIRSGKFGQING